MMKFLILQRISSLKMPTILLGKAQIINLKVRSCA